MRCSLEKKRRLPIRTIHEKATHSYIRVVRLRWGRRMCCWLRSGPCPIRPRWPEIKAFPIVAGFGRFTDSFAGECVELFLCGSANRNRDAQCNQYGVPHIISPRSFLNLFAEVLWRALIRRCSRVWRIIRLKRAQRTHVRRRVGLANGNQRVAAVLVRFLLKSLVRPRGMQIGSAMLAGLKSAQRRPG